MDQTQARKSLEYLVKKYVDSESVKQRMLDSIWDESLPHVPVRGVLNDIRESASNGVSEEDAPLVKELIFRFG